jgi:hypothetical protein
MLLRKLFNSVWCTSPSDLRSERMGANPGVLWRSAWFRFFWPRRFWWCVSRRAASIRHRLRLSPVFLPRLAHGKLFGRSDRCGSRKGTRRRPFSEPDLRRNVPPARLPACLWPGSRRSAKGPGSRTRLRCACRARVGRLGWWTRLRSTPRAGAITVNRYVVDKDTQRAVVLYWYQTPRRVIAGEWAAKFWLAADALRDKRTDTALVRVTTWPASGGDEAATAVATGFARDLYPALREYLPR